MNVEVRGCGNSGGVKVRNKAFYFYLFFFPPELFFLVLPFPFSSSCVGSPLNPPHILHSARQKRNINEDFVVLATSDVTIIQCARIGNTGRIDASVWNAELRHNFSLLFASAGKIIFFKGVSVFLLSGECVQPVVQSVFDKNFNKLRVFLPLYFCVQLSIIFFISLFENWVFMSD